MKSKIDRSQLIVIANKVATKKKLIPREIQTLLAFEDEVKPTPQVSDAKTIALFVALILGFTQNSYPEFFEMLASDLPWWTNLHPRFLAGMDYLWNFLGDAVGKPNIIYHIPNIALYAFGVLGIKKLFDVISRKTWRERVLDARRQLLTIVTNGTLNLTLKKGHSILFVGAGDFVGLQFALDANPDAAVTISESKPSYTNIWNYYNASTTYQNLIDVITRSSGKNAGEYIFFPVRDEQLFLPGPSDYDLSPYKLDILCQDLRSIERQNKWATKQIIIVGDRFHKSTVQSEDQTRVLPKSQDIISLEQIAEKHKKVTLLDPTDIVLREILRIARGRRIVFRATQTGIKKYKKRFFDRLKMLGYKKPTHRGVLTIGYDLFEDQTEQQTLARTIDDYFPIVLSKNVRDALIRNGYKKGEFIYVPNLVLKILTRESARQ